MRSVINQSNKVSKSISKLEYEKISTEFNEVTNPNTSIPPPPPPLLILDLNGTLVMKKRPNPIKRPYVKEFFNYIFGKEVIGSKEYTNWEVMIWSSAQPQNVKKMCELLEIEKRENCLVPTNDYLDPPIHHPSHRYPTRSKVNLSNSKIKSNETPQTNHEHQHQDPTPKNHKRKRSILEIWDTSQMNLSDEDFNRKVSTTKDSNSIWKKIKYLDPYTQQEYDYGPKNHKRLVLEIWDRSQMNLSDQDFNRKVSTTKDLNSIWKKIKYLDPYTQQEYDYGPKNTIIIDDSPEKLLLQPFNLCQIKEFQGDRNDDALLKIIETLKEIKSSSNSNFASYLKSKHDQNQSHNQNQKQKRKRKQKHKQKQKDPIQQDHLSHNQETSKRFSS